MNKKRSPMNFWRRLSRRVQIGLLILALLLVAARIALPYAVTAYVNKKLDSLPEYDGRIGDVDIHLIRGAYSIHDVDILKSAGGIPVPFFSARKLDLSVQWTELFHGSIVSEIYADHARLNFVKGPSKESSQTEIAKSWVKVLEDIVPFKINRFELRQSEVHYRDFHSKPPVNVYLTNLLPQPQI